MINLNNLYKIKECPRTAKCSLKKSNLKAAISVKTIPILIKQNQVLKGVNSN